MSDPRWKRVKGFSRYLISDTGMLVREAYTEPGTGRYMKEVIVKPCKTGEGYRHISVRLLTDNKREIQRSLCLILHNTFPDIPMDVCGEIAVNRFKAYSNNQKIPLNLEGEEWKDCPGYEEFYRVSNYGRIKRKQRIIKRSNGRNYTITESIIKQNIEGRNYRCVVLNNGIISDKYEAVHRLVAKAFIPNPDNLPEVNHKDGDGSNNQVFNLEWSSHRDNAIHAWETGLYKEPHPVTCIETGEQFDSIYALATAIDIRWYTLQSKICSNSPIKGLHYQYTEKL